MATHPADTVTSFKRMIGTDATVTLAGTTLTPEDLSAMVLRSLADDVEAATGKHRGALLCSRCSFTISDVRQGGGVVGRPRKHGKP